MNDSIGSRLGGFLACFEEAMMQDGCKPETLSKIVQVSEVYRNLAAGGLAGFREEFDRGYEETKRGFEEDNASPPLEQSTEFSGPQNG
ncbi:MAG: hypothetical protein AAF709_24680 [Pseudomonadota bacterium]